ncbi:hypothetical protein GGI25_003864 [Coemansia spiralis]|uniref:Uncharacterized protein n=2 Tax=Coemansia TaxID=4863 RepID=A0A9W8KXP2_9FUNG|nr:hypothetical protein BX070DRAFT_224469 [Coemansia spiralis]KAJ1991010.1 hypothetical protein EDC05_003731 [Coemansia umbellata]KAJ2621020.1 hypothetical protein GGI26_004521 [Coemansia sp. RSA 1358]KAJ2675769.1 hypothetical protein GGI25_003864 [Coemansia spiralis]
MLAGAGFLTVMLLLPAHAVTYGTSVEHIGLLMGMANGCTVLGAIMLHHFTKAYGPLNGMVFIHLVAWLSTIFLWYPAKNYNDISIFTMVFCMSAGSVVPMYPLGQLDTKDKESWLLGGTQVVKWAILTTAVAIPVLKVFYMDWVSFYLTQHWIKPAICLVTSGYVSASFGTLVLRFSLSPHLKARL